MTTQALFFLSELDRDRAGEAYAHATHYEAVPVDDFRAMMAPVPVETIRRSTFVDVGAGMGRAVLLAMEYPFKQIVGVELSSSLHEIARDNLSRAAAVETKCRDVRLARADARDYRFPKGNLVVFLFNPFDGEALGQTFERILSTRADGDGVVALYHTPVHRHALARFGAETIADLPCGVVYAFPSTSRSFCE